MEENGEATGGEVPSSRTYNEQSRNYDGLEGDSKQYGKRLYKKI